MPFSMWGPLLMMVVGFYAWFFLAWLIRLRHELVKREVRTDWVQQMIKQ